MCEIQRTITRNKNSVPKIKISRPKVRLSQHLVNCFWVTDVLFLKTARIHSQLFELILLTDRPTNQPLQKITSLTEVTTICSYSNGTSSTVNSVWTMMQGRIKTLGGPMLKGHGVPPLLPSTPLFFLSLIHI